MFATAALAGCDFLKPPPATTLPPPDLDNALNVDLVPIPQIPTLPRPFKVAGRYQRYEFFFRQKINEPGFKGKVFVTVPDGPVDQQRPCLFFAPAGAPAFGGKGLETRDYQSMMPFVEAGFIVVAYEMDGDSSRILKERNETRIAKIARDYQRAKCGLVNSRNAMALALKLFRKSTRKRCTRLDIAAAAVRV